MGQALAQKVRVAMPAKSMTFLNFYVGDKFGVYKAEGLEVSLEVIKTEVGVAGMVAGEIDYTSAIGSAMRAAATGMPIKATMFTMDRVLIYMFARPTIKSIEDLKGGKTVATTGLLATPTYAAKVMARAHGLNLDKDLIFIAMGDVATSLAALQSGAADVAMLSIPFNFKAEELGFRNLGSAVDYLQTPFAGVGAADAKLKSNPSQVKRMIRAQDCGAFPTRDHQGFHERRDHPGRCREGRNQGNPRAGKAQGRDSCKSACQLQAPRGGAGRNEALAGSSQYHWSSPYNETFTWHHPLTSLASVSANCRNRLGLESTLDSRGRPRKDKM